MKHFLDTYAIIEILNGNPAYEGVLSDGGTSLYHLYELHVQIARIRDADTADLVFSDLHSIARDVEDRDILEASRFKRSHRKRQYSYADALGYAMARNRGVDFVTGDEEFRGVDGVRFIKGET